jgi:hypothetical protein
MATLNLANLTFPATILYDGDHLAMRTLVSPHHQTWAWSNTTYSQATTNVGRQDVRGRYYVTRLRFGYWNDIPTAYGFANGYGVGWAGSNAPTSYDTISYYNPSRSRSIRVLIEAGPQNPASFVGAGASVGAKQISVVAGFSVRPTDDNCYHLLYRGGSPANNFTHSGGTLLQAQNNGLIFTDTIPANTTYQYWHYAGLTGGSGGDHLATYFRCSFQEFT